MSARPRRPYLAAALEAPQGDTKGQQVLEVLVGLAGSADAPLVKVPDPMSLPAAGAGRVQLIGRIRRPAYWRPASTPFSDAAGAARTAAAQLRRVGLDELRACEAPQDQALIAEAFTAAALGQPAAALRHARTALNHADALGIGHEFLQWAAGRSRRARSGRHRHHHRTARPRRTVSGSRTRSS